MAIIITLIIIFILLYIYIKYFRMPHLNTNNFVDGTNGVGKTQICVYWSKRALKRQRIKYKIKKIFLKLFSKKEFKEPQPYLYSNLKLKDIPFVPMTKDILTRQNYRCSNNSIGLLDEYSLVADQNIYGKEYKDIVEQMRDFWKLDRHEGFKYVFVNSQNISSVNFTLKDCISNYIFIHHRKKLPFFSILYYREMTYSRDGGGIANVFNNTLLDEDFKRCIIPNSIFKKYDSRAYSVFTDNLPVDDREIVIKDRKDLKQRELTTFMKLNYLYQNLEKEKTTNVQEN